MENNIKRDYSQIKGTYTKVLKENMKLLNGWSNNSKIDKKEFINLISDLVINNSKQTPKQLKFLNDLKNKRNKTDCMVLVYNSYLCGIGEGVDNN